MIRGVHTMFYTSDAEATRAFIRDKLGFPYTDVHDGWLIFELPEADMGCHPTDISGKAGHKTPPAGTQAAPRVDSTSGSTLRRTRLGF